MAPLLGVLFAALLTLTGIGTLLGIQSQGVANQRAAVTAGQLQTIATAAQGYIQTNGALIEAVATAGSPATITVPMLQATGFLSSNVSAVNAYGQTWQVQILQPTAGVLQALVLSQGGTPISTQLAPAIAAMAGAEGGFVPAPGQYGSLSSNVAQGSYGGWQVPLAGYTNPGQGHLAALVQFNNGNATNDYLYRVAVPGQPQLNTMATNLNMGGNSLVAGNNLQAQTATFAAGNGVQIGSSYYYGDSQNSAVRQSGAFYVQNYSGALAPVGAGEVNSSDAVTATNTVYSGNIVSAANDVYAGNTVSGGYAVTSGDVISAANIVWAGNQLEVGATAWPGNGCSPNGAIAAQSDGSGRILDCVNGVWTSPSFTPTPVSLVFGGSAIFGNYYYCALAGGSGAAGLEPYQENSDGTYVWYLVGGSGASRINCF